MNKTLIPVLLAALVAGVNESPAQENPPSVGVGLGLGVGAGIGLSGNIAIERVPGNVVQGRRLFVAKYLLGSVGGASTSATPPGDDADGDGTGGLTSASGSSYSANSVTYTTSLSVYNPNTNVVTFNVRSLSDVVGSVSTNAQVTLAPGQARDVAASLPGSPSGFTRGLVVIESPLALEVIAFYQYRESSTHIQTSRELHEECGCNTKYHGSPFGQ